jgi:F420-0:gamma-glutamyl ligase-like protein
LTSQHTTSKLKAIRVKTRYWEPGTDWIKETVHATSPIVKDGDIITVSEKAISTAKGLLIDENVGIKPGFVAKLLVKIWMRRIWGGPLGKLTKLKRRTLGNLRNFPIPEGIYHKQVAIERAGILQALRHYSEGGIDASNLPYSYVCLPLANPSRETEALRSAYNKIGIKVSTLIVDGDTTYSRGSLHLAPRKVQVKGLIHFGGFITFVIGRALGFISRSTPIAYSELDVNPDWALTLANVAHRVRGHGAGRTVWDMAEKMGVNITEVTWDMLASLDHYPILILRVE